jgi:hypothetical protein
MSAHIAGSARRRREIARRNKEEEMTTYNRQDLEKYEFKIMRSPMGQFRKPEVLTQMLAEEQQFGWNLLEKLDDSRVRLVREKNSHRLAGLTGSDPYRTRYGSSGGLQTAVWLLVFGGLMSGILVFGIMQEPGGLSREWPMIAFVMGIMVITAFATYLKRR